jgi:hypothetical protein
LVTTYPSTYTPATAMAQASNTVNMSCVSCQGVYSSTRRCRVLGRSGNLVLDQSTIGFDPKATSAALIKGLTGYTKSQ